MSTIKNDAKSVIPYSIIHNQLLNDSRISFKARGIMSYLVSKPKGWSTKIKDLYNKGKEGYAAIRSGIEELVLAGYLELINKKNENGMFTGRYYRIHHIPLISEGYRSKENKNKKFSELEIILKETPLKKTVGFKIKN